MHKVYQSTFRMLAAQILAAELILQPADVKAEPALRITVEGGEKFDLPASWATQVGLQVGGYLGMAGRGGQGQAHFIPAAEFPTAFAYVGEVPPAADPVAAPAQAGNAYPVSYTFEEFIQYGINAGGNVVDGMPWSFTFHGRAVTHENNDRYVITTKRGKALNFYRGEIVTVGEDDVIVITNADESTSTYDAVQEEHDRAQADSDHEANLQRHGEMAEAAKQGDA